MSEQPGVVVLFGSGETSDSGRRVFDWLFAHLAPPVRAAVLETPAGFELNSAQVAGQVADFLRQRLSNYQPQVIVVPARKRGTPFSPDDPAIVAPLLQANVIFLGPGSPTYAVRQLRDSLAWHTLIARHRLGAAIVLASAMTVAIGTHALPVYEIYKVGEDLHWQAGLDFFGPYSLSLVFIPHWNNSEGGASLDTSRCFMGQTRFEQLLALLPSQAAVIGVDEHTALVVDVGAGKCQVMGRGDTTVLRQGQAQRFKRGQTFALTELGPYHAPEPHSGLLPEVWKSVPAAQTYIAVEPPTEVLALVEEREAARARRDWANADVLRQRIAALGWRVSDTPKGPRLEPVQGDSQ
jgi:cyanophycinase-like exopeptidase